MNTVYEPGSTSALLLSRTALGNCLREGIDRERGNGLSRDHDGRQDEASQDHEQQQPQNQSHDGSAQQHQHMVEPLLVMRQFGRRRLEADSIGVRLANRLKTRDLILGPDRAGQGD